MAVTINSSTLSGMILTSDNTGVTILQANTITSLTADGTGRLVLPALTTLNTATAGGLEYNNNAIYFTSTGTQRGVIPARQMFVLNTAYAGASSTANQSFFGLTNGVTLATNTVYAFEAFYALSKTAGTTSHSFSLLANNGTATFTNIQYHNLIKYNTTSFVTVPATDSYSAFILTSNPTAILTTLTSATASLAILQKGILAVNVGGTFLPQYTLSAAPGGGYTTQVGSYMHIYPIAEGTANVNIGTWS